MTMPVYQRDVVTTLRYEYDPAKCEDWVFWLDTNNFLWYTVEGESVLITGEQRTMVLRACGYLLDDKEPMRYSVNVENIGTVESTNDQQDALNVAQGYVNDPPGSAGDQVFVMDNVSGEPIFEHGDAPE